jgi:hypothetical protein
MLDSEITKERPDIDSDKSPGFYMFIREKVNSLRPKSTKNLREKLNKNFFRKNSPTNVTFLKISITNTTVLIMIVKNRTFSMFYIIGPIFLSIK